MYVASDTERWLERELERIDSALTAPRTVLERGIPPCSREAIVSRRIVGEISGRYERHLTVRDPIPLAYVEKAFALDLEEGELEETIDLETEPGLTLTTHYEGDGRSSIIGVSLESLKSRSAMKRMIDACANLPAPESTGHASIEQLVLAYSESVIPRLLGSYAPKRL